MRYFNSIKVRLKPNPLRYYLKPDKFQFHKGTIKTGYLYTLAKSDKHFNSIKVRLKHFAISNSKSFNIYFNSIKVRLKPNATIATVNENTFQFHKGTIKTKERYATFR